MNAALFDEDTTPTADADDLVNMNTAYNVRINRGEDPDLAVAAINTAWIPGATVQNLI